MDKKSADGPVTIIAVVVLLLLAMVTAVFAQDTKIYDRNWNLKYRVQGDKVYDRNWNLQYRVKNGKVYDRNWSLKYRVNGETRAFSK